MKISFAMITILIGCHLEAINDHNLNQPFVEIRSAQTVIWAEQTIESLSLTTNLPLHDYCVRSSLSWDSIENMYQQLEYSSILAKNLSNNFQIGLGAGMGNMSLLQIGITRVTPVNLIISLQGNFSSIATSFQYEKNKSLIIKMRYSPLVKNSMSLFVNSLSLKNDLVKLNLGVRSNLRKNISASLAYDFAQYEVQMGLGVKLNERLEVDTTMGYYLQTSFNRWQFTVKYNWNKQRKIDNFPQITDEQLKNDHYYKHKRNKRKKFTIKNLYYPNFAQLIKKGLTVGQALLLLKKRNPCLLSLFLRKVIWPKIGRYLCKK